MYIPLRPKWTENHSSITILKKDFHHKSSVKSSLELHSSTILANNVISSNKGEESWKAQKPIWSTYLTNGFTDIMQIQTKYSIPAKYKMNKINNWKVKFFFLFFCLKIIQKCGCSSFLFATLKGVSFYRFQDFQRIKFFHLHFRDGCDLLFLPSSVSKVYFTSLFKVYWVFSLFGWEVKGISEPSKAF